MRGIGGPPGGEGFAFTGRASLREITDKPGVEFLFRKGARMSVFDFMSSLIPQHYYKIFFLST